MASLISIVVTPISSSIAPGPPELPAKEQFTAIGYYDDITVKDLTSTATWASAYTAVATIASTGIATAVGLGSTTITATVGSIVGSAVLRIAHAQHPHVTPPIIMNTPLGHLKFRQYFTYDTPQIAEGPDPHQGHINYQGGDTVIIQPKIQDALQPNLEIRADIPAPKFQMGQEGTLVKDPDYPVQPVVESSTSSDSTAGIWRRGKVFTGNIPNW